MTRGRWIIFVVIVLVTLGGLIYLSRSNEVDLSDVDSSAIQESDHVYGNSQASVVLFEYGDFQCPGCGAAFPIVSELKQKYQSQIAFVFRNFPLTSIHPNALAAATAAEAAAKQGKFYEMHDQLFANQAQWEGASAETRGQIFESYATAIGLDLEQYKQDFADASLKEKIDFDLALGREIGVNSTPTFYLNGEQLESSVWQSKETFEERIRTALQDAGVELPEEVE
jgi:protein-disulfide isomerase